MAGEQAFDFVKSLVSSKTQRQLNDNHKKIFTQFWQDTRLTYEDIASNLGYSQEHLRYVGAELWQLMSTVFDEKVTKSNFCNIVQKHYNLNLLSSTINKQSQVSPNYNFVGRDRAIADLNNLAKDNAKIILIQGQGGVGKTTLARKYFKTQAFYISLELWMPKDVQNIDPIESVVEEWLRKYFQEEPGREFSINLDRLQQKLRDPNQKIGILIDRLETALDRNGRIIESSRGYIELLTRLSDYTLNSLTIITSRERFYETGVDIHNYPLRGLDESAWRKFFANHQLDSNCAAVDEMCQAYGGNAQAMKIICGVIKQDYEGDVNTYWQANKDDLLREKVIENLVTSQFERLKQLDINAYNLLCRMGCYRYQDVTNVKVAGLECLLWEVAQPQSRRIIKSLVERSLIECRKERYWLHAVIWTEALDRLRNNGEWEIVHRKAAEYWHNAVNKIEKSNQALVALEAYYHYIAINDFEEAAKVLNRPIDNKWDNPLALGVLLARLGLFEKLISVITNLTENIKSDKLLTVLYNMLGNAYREIGTVNTALNYHEKADIIAEKHDFIFEKISSQFNIGLCCLDLWEIQQAKNVFTLVIEIAKNAENHYQYIIYSQCNIAYINSHIGLKEDALGRLAEVKSGLSNEKLTSWGKGVSLLVMSLTYRNLDEIDTAFDICHRIITYCQEKEFTSLQARSISCLASLYREKREFTTAIAKHNEAIEMMQKFGDKSNLAAAHYQLGLTYKRMDELSKSHESFIEAIHLYNKIPASKQVERVQAEMRR